MKKNYFPALILMGFVFGCKVLSKQETAGLQSLTKAMDTASILPSKFVCDYYGVAFETQQANYAVQLDNPKKIDDLDKLVAEESEADSIVKGYSSGYGVLKKYADLLLSLSDTAYLKAFSKQKDAFIPSFDTLIVNYNNYFPKNKLPVATLGSLIGKVVDEIGSRRIKYLQRKYLRQVVTEADTVVNTICRHYNIIDFYKNNKQLASLNTDIEQSYKAMLKYVALAKISDPFYFYKQCDPIYLTWKNKANVLTNFNIQTLNSMTNIAIAHTKFKKELYKKTSFKDFTISLQALYGSVNALQENYQKFRRNFSSLK